MRRMDGPDAGSGPEHAVATARIEDAYPGYHVWTSDDGWWYATRTHPPLRGPSATVHAPGPVELAAALAAEGALGIGRAMAGAR